MGVRPFRSMLAAVLAAGTAACSASASPDATEESASLQAHSSEAGDAARRDDDDRGGDHFLDPRIARGFHIAPVALDLKGKNRILVGLGSYLVNAAGGCNDCHTNPSYAPGGNPFLGEKEQINTENYLAGGTAFGPFISRNITPDETGKPAGLTRDEFIEVIRTGLDRTDGGLLQVMPWPVYRNLTTRELSAIFEYLRAIPHAEPAAP